jgi:hypothetical protein
MSTFQRSVLPDLVPLLREPRKGAFFFLSSVLAGTMFCSGYKVMMNSYHDSTVIDDEESWEEGFGVLLF